MQRRTGPWPLPRHGGRISLRRFVVADLPAFQRYRRQPELGRYQGWSVLSDTEARAFIEEMEAASLFQPAVWCQIAIADRKTDRLIGDIGVCVASAGDEAEIGFTLEGESHGCGLATEAVRDAIALLFEVVQIERVVAVTDARNLRSVRLLERVGMRENGTTAAVFKGKPCIECTFVIGRKAASDA